MDPIARDPSRPQTRAVDVVIVGAGLAGLACAWGLRDAGLEIVVVDRRDEIDERSLNWGWDLQPNGLSALASLGLLDQVVTSGARHRHWTAHRAGGGELSSWSYELLDHSCPFAVCIRPHILIGLLRQAVRGVPGIELLIPAEVEGYHLEPGGHQVHVTQGGRRLRLETRLLVGADGPRSGVRTAAGIDVDLGVYPHGWVDSIIPQNDEITEGHLYFGPGEYLGIVPTRPGELVTFHLTRAADDAGYQATFGNDLGNFRRRYLELAPILAPMIDNVTSWDQVRWAPSLRVRARRWVADGIALAGDAALTVNAITAEGASLAVEGGTRLAAVVGNCFERGDLSAAALAAYEAWSRPEAEGIQEIGDLCSRVFASKNPVVSRLKERMLRRLDRDPRMQHHILAYSTGLRWSAPQRLGWRDGLAAALGWPAASASPSD